MNNTRAISEVQREYIEQSSYSLFGQSINLIHSHYLHDSPLQSALAIVIGRIRAGNNAACQAGNLEITGHRLLIHCEWHVCPRSCVRSGNMTDRDWDNVACTVHEWRSRTTTPTAPRERELCMRMSIWPHSYYFVVVTLGSGGAMLA